MFLRTEELKKSLLELIRVSLAQYSVSGSGNSSCCWGDHGSLVASCSPLPDTPSASISAVSRIICPCLILLISMLEGSCLNVLVLPVSLSYLRQTSLSGGSLPIVGRCTINFSSQLPCAVGAPTRFCVGQLVHHIHSFKIFVISSLSCLFSKPKKSQFTFGKNQQQNPNKKKNPNPKPNLGSLTKNRNKSLLRLF